MLSRLVAGCARGLCAFLAVALAAWLVVRAPATLGGDVREWLRLYGPLIALAAAGLAALLARLRLAPGRLLKGIPAPAFAALVFAVALASGIWTCFRLQKGIPDVPDEFSYLHQARAFADGFLAPPSPPLADFYYVSWGVHDRGLWYSVFPPGYGLLLAVGVKAGVPWLVNPVLSALLALVLYALACDLLGGDGLAARVAVLLYLASWFRLMHAGSYMSHPAAALFAALAVLGAWRGVLARGSPWWGAAGGAALGALVATRPLDAAIVGIALLPAVGYALARRAPLRRLLPPLAAMAPLLLGYGLYNRALTGSATLLPQQRYMQLKEERGDCLRLGFGPGVGQCPITQKSDYGKDGFQPIDALRNTDRRLDAYVRYGFAFAPLAVLPLLGLVGGALGPEARRRALLGGLLLSSVVGYGLFFYHGVVYGARFYYQTWPFVVLLGAAAIGDADRRLSRRPALRAALGGALIALLAVGLRAEWPAVQKDAGDRPRTEGGAQLKKLRRPDLHDAVVFVDSMVIPAAMTRHPGRIADNHPLVVKDNGDAADAGFMRLFPERRPVRLRSLLIVPLHYPRDAPIRHEGNALYPLEVAEGGFGIPISHAFKLELSNHGALRFRARVPGARFEIPTWVPPADAGDMVIRVELASYPHSPAFRLAVDGRPVSDWLDTRAAVPALHAFDVPARLTGGRHRLEVRLREAGTFLLDYLELRKAR